MNARAQQPADELSGHLSHEEQVRTLSNVELNAFEARAHYELILSLAKGAQRDLRAHRSAWPIGNDATARRLINSFVWANVALSKAAREVERLERLARDTVTSEILL